MAALRARGARLLALVTLLTLTAGACAGGGGDQSAAPTTGQTPATTAAAGAAGASGSCPAGSGLSGNIADHGAAAASGSKLQVQAGDSFFAPTCQTGVRSGTVTLVVHNSGQILHNLSVPGQGIDTDVAPAQTITVQVKLGGKALPYFCKYHRTSGMWGSLLPQAEPGAAAGPARARRCAFQSSGSAAASSATGNRSPPTTSSAPASRVFSASARVGTQQGDPAGQGGQGWRRALPAPATA